ncbi:MAG: type II toxin-antitoxin system RelE/ParE family toxin [Candidatus Sericytochromatia bacterium]|nr:type II toxin-antitoxin system RelE/ParE family toxin [Candidatus Sericytochromatia bacterium]
MIYKIFETDNFIEEINDLSLNYKNIQEKIKEYVYPQLKNNPYFGKNIKKLKGYKPDTWRYRIGEIRLFYEITDKDIIVLLISATQRKDSY